MSTLRPTAEQSTAVDACATGRPVVLQAGAGTGKTSTLRMISAGLLGQDARNGLYVAFNKPVQLEAEASFPRGVVAKTGHGLAYAGHGRLLAHKLPGTRSALKLRDAVKGLRLNAVLLDGVDGAPSTWVQPEKLVGVAQRSVERFCRSADDDLTRRHLVLDGLPAGTDREQYTTAVLDAARRVWADWSAPEGVLRMPHDVYRKLWALARPTLRCDFLMLDEAQDTPPVLAKVVLDQACQLVVVGDSAQQIYGWAGAIDAMGKMITADPNVIECFLTQSWRFGEVIATEANKWLGQLPTPLRLSGNPGLDSELVDLGSDARAVLRRTNVGAVGEVISALFAGRAVAMVGGGGEIKSLAYAARDLMSGRPTEHPELSAYDNWNEVRAAAQGGDGDDSLKAFVAMVDRFGPNSLIDAMAKLVPEKAAELVVSTAHKAKGREWDSVRICGDFEQRMDEEGEPKPLDSTDAMLAYVAVTRARLRLDRGPLAYIDELTGSTASVATG
jgi:hypothetical protein